MTTEVLRNMIYERSELLEDLSFVVLDEVHFLQDRYRGAVWEEVIIHLPLDVKIVFPVRHALQRRGVRRLAAHHPGRHPGDNRDRAAG